jgi:hypothetical protein
MREALRSPRWVAAGVIAVGLLVLAFVALRDVRPFVQAPRGVSEGTAVPPAVFALAHVPIERGQQACLNDVTLTRTLEVAHANATIAGGAPGPRLRVSASGPGGYRTSTVVRRGWKSGAGLSVRLTAPPRDLRGSVCFENLGRRTVALYATAEGRTLARPATTVDGAPVEADLSLAFSRADPVALADRPGELIERMTAFVWSPLGSWAGWVVAVLLVVGVPLGVLLALGTAVRRDLG